MTKKTEDTTKVPSVDCFEALKTVGCDNLLFYKDDPSMYEYLKSIIDSIEVLPTLVKDVESQAHNFNFSEEVKGNGYYSWVKVTYSVVKNCLKMLEELTIARNSYFFRKDHYIKELKAYSEAIDSLCLMMNYLLTLISWCQTNHDLIAIHKKHIFHELLMKYDKYLNQHCFYGRCFGFQFCDSMATVVKGLNILMASFSEIYYSNGQLIDPILRGSKYWIDPELRAKRVVNIIKYASADFCKNFWFLGEIEMMQKVPSMMLPNLQVNKVFLLEPVPLVIQNIYGKNVDIPIPSAHLGPGPVTVRLLSSSLRLGMEIECSSKSGFKYPSDTLVFHCHGGGFLAQSSRSHENYLRQWAIDLDVPILSIDYSLAPEAPYPRGLEEVFYAYCWALSNPSLLGSTGEKIVVVGDSAGANLNTAMTLMCLEYGVKKPHGLFLAYVPVILSMDASPARMLTFIDPLIPANFLLNIIKAYTFTPEAYKAQESSHEKKLRRNMSVSEIMKKGGLTNGCEQEIIEDVKETDSPIKLNRSNSAGMISRLVNSISTKLAALSPSRSLSEGDELDKLIDKEHFLPLLHNMIVETERDPYFSPYFAADSLLMNFPPVKVLTTDLDPFLDDCIMFAKKLKRLGVPTSLDILPGLCHGFLNFSMLSGEAHEGANLCMQRISELIQNGSDIVDASSAEE